MNKGSAFTGFLQEFAKIFTMICLLMSILEKIITDKFPDAPETSSIFSLGGAGLPYSAIFQFAALALVLAVFSRLLFFSPLESKIPYLLKLILLTISNLFATSVFAILFKWFPLDNMRVWIIAFLAIFIANAAAAALSFLFVLFENRKYNALLDNYKKRHANYNG